MKKYKDYRFVKLLGGIMLSIFILLLWFHYNSLNKPKNVALVHAHTDKVMTLVDNFVLYMFDVEVAQNHYILSKNPAFLTQFRSEKERAIAHLGKLEQLMSFSFAEKSKFDSL